MSEIPVLRPDRDYTKDVDQLLPNAEALATVPTKLSIALVSLLMLNNVEKSARGD